MSLVARVVGGPRALKQLLISKDKAGLAAALQVCGRTAAKTGWWSRLRALLPEY